MSGTILVQHADGRWFQLASLLVSGAHRVRAAGLPPTINPPSGPFTSGVAIPVSGSAAGFATVWAVLFVGGAEQGARASAAVTDAAWSASLTPATPGSYTVRLFNASVAGTLLAESATFSVS